MRDACLREVCPVCKKWFVECVFPAASAASKAVQAVLHGQEYCSLAGVLAGERQTNMQGVANCVCTRYCQAALSPAPHAGVTFASEGVPATVQ